jgi:nickel/cobalt exporter
MRRAGRENVKPAVLFLLYLFVPFVSFVDNPLHAHPVPKSNYDRTIQVSLRPDKASGQVEVRVHYRLEVDELTIIDSDMREFRDEIDIAKYRGRPLEYYAEFTRLYAPIYAGNLVAKANGKDLQFECLERDQRLKDEKGEPLGHLRCDLVFRAFFTPLAEQENEFKFREANYLLQAGKIDVGFVKTSGVKVTRLDQADEAVKNRSPLEWQPGDEIKLRSLKVRFTIPGGVTDTPPVTESKPALEPSARGESGLVALLLHTDYGLWLVLLMAAGLGAVHALTPGHGKTLVAAYLVGQRGTVWHALVLGLVTTLTHTGVVLVLAGLLTIWPQTGKELVQAGLGLAMGVAIACLGFWLLLQRLSGRADHIHLGGHDHHHHHHGHSHAHPALSHPDDSSQGLGWWGLVVLGMTGGIIPCWDAVALLGAVAGSGLLWLALPALIAFSAGLAGVLVALGILVVKARSFATSKFGEGRLVRALPLLSAVLIAAMGLWLCYESVQSTPDLR